MEEKSMLLRIQITEYNSNIISLLSNKDEKLRFITRYKET